MRQLLRAGVIVATLALPPVMASAGTDAVPRADVVILGEVHDNPAHHAWQAEAVAALAPAALVFEMLLPEQAAAATPELHGDAAALEVALDWEDRGWPDFAMYHPIFLAAPGAAIHGGDLPREAVRRAVSEGAAAVFGGDAARFGLSTPLPAEEQAAREAMQAAAHCDALPVALLPGMVEAQRLRDAGLARGALEAHAQTGGPVVVITGTGHARRDWGVPAALALAAPGLSVFAVGQVEGDPAPGAPFDMVRSTAPHPRPDPCAAFR